MALLPTSPAPYNVRIEAEQPTSTNIAIDGVSRQVRSRGVFIWKVTFSYKTLSFEERDTLEAFLISQSGRLSEFDITIPSRSENEGVTSVTGTFAASYAANTTVVTINGVTGALKPNHLLRVNGKKATYVVVSANQPVSGSQQVTIMPPLRYPVALNDTVITKNVTMNVYLEKDSIQTSNTGMTSSIKFSMIESPML